MITMGPDEFYQSRRQEWELLSGLVEKAQRDVRRLSPQEVERLASLYRAAASDLALAKRDFPRQQVTQYLNQLVARTHAILIPGRTAGLPSHPGFCDQRLSATLP